VHGINAVRRSRIDFHFSNTASRRLLALSDLQGQFLNDVKQRLRLVAVWLRPTFVATATLGRNIGRAFKPIRALAVKFKGFRTGDQRANEAAAIKYQRADRRSYHFVRPKRRR